MNVLYVNNTSVLSDGGGGEERLDEVSARLVENGHTVTLLLGKTAPKLARHTTHEGRRIRHVTCVPEFVFRHQTLGYFLSRYLFAFASLPVLVSMLRREDHDIVVETMTPHPTFAVLVAKLFGTPIVATRHEFFDETCFEIYDPFTATIQLLVQNVLRVFEYTALIVPSTHVKHEFMAYGVSEDRIEVIPNGVNHRRYTQPDITPESGRLVVVGRLTKRKGQERLVRALRAVREKGCDATLDVVGDGPARTRLDSMIEKLGLRDHVTLHGFVDADRKIELLNRAEMFVFASKQEGFGIVLLEAMAAGLPVIAKRLPVYEDFFRDRVNGSLLDTDSPRAFADEIERLLSETELRHEMGERNMETAARFSWEATTNQTERVLERYCGERSAESAPRRIAG